MTVVDTLFVGRLGASALAAGGVGGIASFTVMCFGFGLLRGVKVLIAHAVGAGREDLVARHAAAGLIVAVALGVAFAALGVFIALGMPLLVAGEESGRLAATYVGVRSLGAPFALVASALRETRYALGDSRGPMRAALAANLVNVPLNAVFIWSFGWGVGGAAWATVAAQGVEAIWLHLAQRGRGFAFRACTRGDLRSIWRYGMPLGLERLLDVGSFSLMVALFARVSDTEVAAHHVGVQLVHFSFLPGMAVGEAVSVLAGQAVGADEDELVLRIARSGWALGMAFMLVCSATFLLAGPFLVAPFTPAVEVRENAVRLLQVAAGFVLVYPVYIVANGVLRGVGDVRFASIATVASAWGCTPVFAALLGVYMGLGALGGWIGLAVEIVVGSAVMGARLAGGFWLPAAQRARKHMNERAVSA
jgi:MATE family multidrug resistance protein